MDLLPIVQNILDLTRKMTSGPKLHVLGLEVCHTKTENPHYLALVIVGSSMEIDLINPSTVKAMNDQLLQANGLKLY